MKKAIQRLVRGDDGRVRVVYIDAVTLKELKDITGYDVLNTENNYWEPVKTVDKPSEPSDKITAKDFNKQEGDHLGQTGLQTWDQQHKDTSVARKEVQKAIQQDGTNDSTKPSASFSLSGSGGINGNVKGGIGLPNSADKTPKLGGVRPEVIPDNTVNDEETVSNTPTGLAQIDYSGLAGKQRNQKPDKGFMDKMASAVAGFFGPGYSIGLESGKGHKAHNEKGNHPTGFAGDFDVIGPDGNRVSQSRMEDFGAYAASQGFTGVGIGPGYMAPGRMHLDTVHKTTQSWGAGNTYATQTPGVNDAIEQAGRTGAPVYGLGLPEYQPNIPTDKPTQSIANQTVDRAKTPDLPNDYEDAQSNPLGRFDSVSSSRAGFTGIIGADAKEYGLTGDMAVRNNNPGNLVANEWSNPIGTATINPTHSFAVYGTPQEGAAARASLLSGKKYSSLSIYDAMHLYAPPEDSNNTLGYIDHVSKMAGVPSSTKISDMSQTQFDSFLDGISSWESSKKPADVTDSLGRHIGSYSNGELTRDQSAKGYYSDRGSLMDTPSETSGIGRGSRVGGSYSGRTGIDSPGEGRSRFGGGLGYSGNGGLDSPSEGSRSFGNGLGSRNSTSTSDKEKDRSLDKDTDRTDHTKGGRMTD